jgi:hypothetical protein
MRSVTREGRADNVHEWKRPGRVSSGPLFHWAPRGLNRRLEATKERRNPQTLQDISWEPISGNMGYTSVGVGSPVRYPGNAGWPY